MQINKSKVIRFLARFSFTAIIFFLLSWFMDVFVWGEKHTFQEYFKNKALTSLIIAFLMTAFFIYTENLDAPARNNKA